MHDKSKTNNPALRKIIYEPSGAAAEYAEYACNLYKGCPHGCDYCYVPQVLRIQKNAFHSMHEEAPQCIKRITRDCKKLPRASTVFLCFTCDPYPWGEDTYLTRDAIRTIKQAGHNVKILTKAGTAAARDFDLLGSSDWFGITYSGALPGQEPKAAAVLDRIDALAYAHDRDIKTWVSIEPVIDPEKCCDFISNHYEIVDHFYVGKLNHVLNDTDWAAFHKDAVRALTTVGASFTIKSALLQSAAIAAVDALVKEAGK